MVQHPARKIHLHFLKGFSSALTAARRHDMLKLLKSYPRNHWLTHLTVALVARNRLI